MDKIKRVSKSVKCLLNEVQCVYREKLRDLEGDIKGSQEEILRTKIRILHSYVNDLSDQNGILVHTVEELEKEANEKVSRLKAKLQASEEGIKDSDHQRRRLEEDNKCLKAEIQKLKADTGALTRVVREAQRARGLDVTGLTLRPQTPESVTDQSAHSSQLPQKPGDLMKAQVEDLQNQLKTKNRIIQSLEEEIKTRLSHRVQEKNEGNRVAEAPEGVCKEEVCKPSVVQKRTHTHTEIHRKRLHETKKQLSELKKECEEKQKQVEKLQAGTTKREVLMKEKAEELQRAISEKRNLELELAVITEKHRTAQHEASSRDQAILQLRAELQVTVEKNQGVQEELGLQEAEVSRLNEKVRKQQAHLQELREMCRHGNARMDHEQHKTQQLQSQLHLAQQQLKRQAERAERLQGELTASRLDHATDAERWTQRNLLLHREVQQLQEQNLQHTQNLREHGEKLAEAEHTLLLAQKKVTEYEEILKKRHTEIRLLNQKLEEIQDQVQKSRNSSQSQRSALEIFKQKYTSAMEKVLQLQVQIQRTEEEAELSQKQMLEARAAEMSSLESRYEHKAKEKEEAMELLTHELQAALEGLKSHEERNLQREEEMEELQLRMELQHKQVQKEVAELQNTCLTLRTRNEELQKVHDKLWKVTEEKNQKEKENQVMRYELKQLGLQLQQLLSFFTKTADAVLEQEDSAVFIPSLLRNTEEQLNDNPEEKEDIPQFTWIEGKWCVCLCVCVCVCVCLSVFLTCWLLTHTAAAAETQFGGGTQAENTHLHQEREQLVTNINLWIIKHKAANESLAARIKQQNKLLTSISLEREYGRVDEHLSKINHVQSRLRSNMRSVTLLNQQLNSMSEENKRNKKLLEKEQKRRSHLEQFLGLSVNQSSVPLFSPPSLHPSDLEFDQMETQLRGTWEKRSKSALQ
ncbi:hypothetical protein Q7C36_023080 [Tachysurus vachellii]|uniref:Uncharacterized protein n=1 Tax=Tachysurus vachellii TaxID=175792 RepID=A0AA88LJF9_TACVA|nr:hypothetical protein Q7C36_023080 [Tachysurus vachellii]